MVSESHSDPIGGGIKKSGPMEYDVAVSWVNPDLNRTSKLLCNVVSAVLPYKTGGRLQDHLLATKMFWC